MIQTHSRSTQLILDRLKFKPAVKYPTIKEEFDIKDNYNLVKELGHGTLGKTWLATKYNGEIED